MRQHWPNEVSELVATFARWDVVRALFEGPGAFISLNTLASYVGRSADEVEEELAALVAGGFVEEHRQEGQSVYALSARAVPLVEEVVLACRDEEICLALVAELVHKWRNRVQPNEQRPKP
ncbi:MAG: hypothetical protein Q9O62_04095 [Ardenticatenia bacterium]|nr:hypothetical protein [Ardenticatenia bacterium]